MQKTIQIINNYKYFFCSFPLKGYIASYVIFRFRARNKKKKKKHCGNIQ